MLSHLLLVRAKTQYTASQDIQIIYIKGAIGYTIIILKYKRKRIQSEQFTFWIVVEDTVVGAGIRMAVPESVSTRTQRRQLYFVLLQFLF